MHDFPAERPTLPTSVGTLGKPTRTRYWLIVFAIVLAVVQYIDRVCIAQTMPDMARELGLDDRQKGAVFSAFGLAYALFEIPTGWLGDRVGARKVLLRVVLWWSFFTAATGWVWSYLSLLVTRFLFGAGEAGCFPNLTKAFSNWLPRVERTRVQATMWMGARWGGAFTPLLVVAVMSVASWRQAFVIFALLGVAWAAVFAWWFRDNPRDHKGVNAAELELLKENEENLPGHGAVPWSFLGRPTVWLLWVQYFCLSYGWYFYITWLPAYLKDARGTDLKSNALMSWLAGMLEGPMHLTSETTTMVLAAALAGIPLFFGGFGSLTAGWISNRLIVRGVNLTRIRRVFAYAGFTGAAILLMASYYIKDPLLAMLAMGFASFCNDLTMPGAWSTCMDVGGKFAGTVSGSMNMMGNFGGMLCPLAVGFILYHTQRDWHLAFLISSIVYLLGGFCWAWIDPVTPLEEPEHEHLPLPSTGRGPG
ncbi:MAG TPA: MFS transporter [Verrucomicrobiae bacterium]|nr:MFS transporter [Verrucomicrobiae bacterium]